MYPSASVPSILQYTPYPLIPLFTLLCTHVADLFMSERGAMLVTAWFIITVILVAGVMLHVGLGWIHVDVARRIYKFLDVRINTFTRTSPYSTSFIPLC